MRSTASLGKLGKKRAMPTPRFGLKLKRIFRLFCLNFSSNAGSGVPSISCILSIWSISLAPGNKGRKLSFKNKFYFILKRKTKQNGLKLRHYFKHDTANAPYVHRITIKTVGHKAFRRSIPSSRNVLGERRPCVDLSDWTEIGQFE